MEPEAQLIAAQAAEELARQQATGPVDEIQRGRMAQQILQGAGQQAQAREAQQQQGKFARERRVGDTIAAAQAQAELDKYRRETDRLSRAGQAIVGAGSAAFGMYADELAKQEALKKNLALAEQEGGVEGAIKFLNQNPEFDPGEETLQRLYAGSEMGQQDAIDLADALEAQRVRTRGQVTKARTNRLFDRDIENLQAFEDAQSRLAQSQGEVGQEQIKFADAKAMAALARADEAALAASKQREAEDAYLASIKRQEEMFRQGMGQAPVVPRPVGEVYSNAYPMEREPTPIVPLGIEGPIYEPEMRTDAQILAERVADARMQKIAELGYDPALQMREEAILRENTPPPPLPFEPEVVTPITQMFPPALTSQEDADILELLRLRQAERDKAMLPDSLIRAIRARQGL
jgi:hypothetical protein